MFVNAFIGQQDKPNEAEIAAALGPAAKLWEKLLAELAGEYKVDVKEWKSYSRKAGWALCLRQKKRAIVYLSPCKGTFWASFALGDKAIKGAKDAGLPARIFRIMAEAKRYAEGTAVRIEVKTAADVSVVKKLAALKIAN